MDESPTTEERETTSMEMTSMESRQLHSSQKEAMKKILEFSGESVDLDIDEWLFDLTNLFSVMKLNDETRILETMGKLTGPALRWYQENLRSFTTWQSAEQSLRNRFKEYTSDSQVLQEFFQIRQEENQSVISFYENVMKKYKRARTCISEQQVITLLQTGVKNSLKEFLFRNEKDITKPEEWLQHARQEEHIQKRIQQQRNDQSIETAEQPFFESIAPVAAVQLESSNIRPSNKGGQARINRHPTEPSSHHNPMNNRTQRTQNQYPNNRIQRTQNQYQNNRINRKLSLGNNTQQTGPCLVCNRKNHPTKECFYKKENGCFKCGQSNHRINDCPKRHFFE